MNSLDAKKSIADYLETIGAWRSKITYKLRDRSVSRQRYRWSPIPVYYDENNQPYLIPEEELPVLLPLDLENYKPTGKSPLEDHPTFPVYEKEGKLYRRECDTLDAFMCSSFYFLRYPDANNPDELGDARLLNKCFPVDFYIGGKEHTVGHLLYARFIHKFLFDQGYLSCPEPFQRLVHQGMVLGADGRKMSKRRWNVIDPMEIIEQYGSDVLRMYLMFMGPVEQDKVRNDGALAGIARFLRRVRELERLVTENVADDAYLPVQRLFHKTIKWLTHDMERLKFNTAVSKLMILVNGIEGKKLLRKEDMLILWQLLTPFAPNIWAELSKKYSLLEDTHSFSWPKRDELLIIDELIQLPVQINGKLRATIEISPDMDEQTVLDIALNDENIQKYVNHWSLTKVIYIPQKILNIVL